MTGTVYLGGGGTPREEQRVFAAMLPGVRRVLYWPFALPEHVRGTADGWLRAALETHGSSAELVTWTTLDEHHAGELDRVDLLVVGGGNTFELLAYLREHQFVEPVRSFIAAGGSYYGGSAGAILAGPSIAPAETEDENSPGLTDLSALGLMPFLVAPHYTDARLPAMLRLGAAVGVPILALPETCGVMVRNDEVVVLGPDDAWTIVDGIATRRINGEEFATDL